MKAADDPRIRLMARGAFPMCPDMDALQVESHRAKWIKAVEHLGDRWQILRQRAAPQKSVIFLPSKVTSA